CDPGSHATATTAVRHHSENPLAHPPPNTSHSSTPPSRTPSRYRPSPCPPNQRGLWQSLAHAEGRWLRRTLTVHLPTTANKFLQLPGLPCFVEKRAELLIRSGRTSCCRNR